MKKKILILFILLPILSYSQNRVKHSFYVHDPFDGSDIAFNAVFDKYNLDTTLSTVLIIWSKKTCGSSCSNLINRYISSNTKKFNLILVNGDGVTGGKKDTINGNPFNTFTYGLDETTLGILKIAKEDWSNATNLYLFAEKGGLDKFLNIDAFPQIIVFNNNLKPILNQTGFNLHPSIVFGYLYNHQSLDYLKGNPVEVSNYAFSVLQQDTISKDFRTHLYNSLLIEEDSVKNDNRLIVKYYYCLSKLSVLDSDFKKAEMYLNKVTTYYISDYKTEKFVWEKFGSVSKALDVLEKSLK